MRTFSQILLTQALIFFEPDAIVQVRYRLTLIAVSSGASEQNREDIVQDVLFQVIRQVLAQQQVPWQSGLGWRYLRNAIRNQVIGFREKSSRPEFLEFLGQQQRVASPNVPASGRDVIIPDLQRLFDYLAQRARLARRSCDRETFDVAWQELRIALFLPPKARGGEPQGFSIEFTSAGSASSASWPSRCNR